MILRKIEDSVSNNFEILSPSLFQYTDLSFKVSIYQHVFYAKFQNDGVTKD